MATISYELEHTIFINGVFSKEDCSADEVVTQIIESYTTQKEEITAEVDAIQELIKEKTEELEEVKASIKTLKDDKEALKDLKRKVKDLTEDIKSLHEILESDYKDKKPHITLVINSPGGEFDHFIQIYDTIQLLNATVATVVNGSAFSAGALLSISGSPGHRYITPNSRMMFHAVSMGIEGKTQDIKVDYKESERLNQQLVDIIMKHTGLSLNEAKTYADRDIYIIPKDAIQLRMMDHIVDAIE